MKTIVVIALCCLSVAGGSRSAEAATSETFGGQTLQTCAAGTVYQGLEITQAVNLNYWSIYQFYPSGTTVERALYWAPTSAGPYALVWSAPLLLPASYSGFVNVDPGFLVFAQSSTASGSWNCRAGDGSPSNTIPTFSIGTVGGGAVGPPTASWPTMATFALQPNLVQGAGMIWSGFLYPPTLSYTGAGQYPEDGGGPYRFVMVDSSASSDPDGTIASRVIRCNTDPAASQPTVCSNATCNCRYINDDGVYTARVTITDNDGLVAEEEFTIEIVNQQPVATGTCDNGTCVGTEGDSLSFACDATDPGWNDVPALSWDLDGALSYGPTYEPGLGYGVPFAGSKSYADDGTFSAVCGAEDNEGGVDTDALTVTIFNADPVLGAVSGATTANEGSAVGFSTSATDLGLNDVLSFAWGWGDATPPGSGASSSHTWADEGTYTVTTTVDDGDGGSDSVTRTIAVANVAPTLSGTCPASAAEGTAAGFGVSAADPGVGDTLSWSVTGLLVGDCRPRDWGVERCRLDADLRRGPGGHRVPHRVRGGR